ncbi:MAG TPA: efflux RND transporter periplasmic adaptor subunit [Methylomirabilota bacterium]|nr:efflux RND transporter periplasmic adaptor subunit [Methylomirabilota bacterium]
MPEQHSELDADTAGSLTRERSSASGHAPRKRRWWIWILVVAVIAGFLIYRRHSASETGKVKAAPPARSVPIVATTAQKGDIGVYINAIGTVTPVYTVTVTSRVQGQIMQVHYQEGQLVHKDGPLLDIDPRPYQAQLTQVEGQLARDQAALNEARIDLDRYQQAYSRNAIAKQQLDDQQQIVLQDEGTVKNDEGQLANARVNLDYCHITSPIDGRVGLRLVDPGNIVQANSSTALVVITQLQPITMIFSVAEDYLPQIQTQLRQGHRLVVDAFNRDQTQKLASGYLLTLDNVIDPTTGTLKLKALFPNTDNALFPSQFVNARLLVETEKGVTLIPSAAIQRSAQGAFVYVINPDQTASMRPVTSGTADGTFTTDGTMSRVEGIDPGVVVAVNGFDKLQDGARVSIQKTPGGAGPGSGAGGATSGSSAATIPSSTGVPSNPNRGPGGQ